MAKDTSNTVKPFYRPAGSFVPSTVPANRFIPTARQLISGGISQQSPDTASSAETAVSPGFVSAAQPVQSTNDGVSNPKGSVDAQRLQDRITSCLALQATSASAWAISMRLHRDLAPLSRFRLACNHDGKIELTFHSTLMSVVEAIRIQIPCMTQALSPWSTSTPQIKAELCTSVNDL